MNDNPKDIVRAGYDKVSEAYQGDVPSEEQTASYTEWTTLLTERLPKNSRVLELGCGCGVPGTALLSGHFDVLACDISERQIERARRLVQNARFICQDMTGIDFAAGTFDAVVALYSVIHVPLGEQNALLRRVATWLRPGGLLLATVGHTAWTGTEEGWLGVSGATMYWSHASEDVYVRWLSDAGLETLVREFVPEGNGGHTLLLAEKPAVEPK